MCHTGVSRTLSVSYRCQSDLECVTQVSVSSAHEYSALVHRSMCNVCGVFRQNATFPDTARCKSAKRRRPHVHAPLPGGDKKIAGVERRDSSERKKNSCFKNQEPPFHELVEDSSSRLHVVGATITPANTSAWYSDAAYRDDPVTFPINNRH